MLDQPLEPAHSHLKPTFLLSFGDFSRIDYGTGHETSFMLFLAMLTILGIVSSGTDMIAIARVVFPAYLDLVWKLQDVYRLEPAGSHGVWGLDDFHFIPYLLGASALASATSPPPVSSTLLIPTPDKLWPYPEEVKHNLYFSMLKRVHQLKRGPFYEHSAQLYSIGANVMHWKKVYSGLGKMYKVIATAANQKLSENGSTGRSLG